MSGPTPLRGALAVTAMLDDLGEATLLPLDPVALDRLIDSAEHIVAWAKGLRFAAVRWPAMPAADRERDAEPVAVQAGDLLHACDALTIALDGTADEYENR